VRKENLSQGAIVAEAKAMPIKVIQNAQKDRNAAKASLGQPKSNGQVVFPPPGPPPRQLKKKQHQPPKDGKEQPFCYSHEAAPKGSGMAKEIANYSVRHPHVL